MTLWTPHTATSWRLDLDARTYLLTHRGGSWWLLGGETVLARWAGCLTLGEVQEAGEREAAREAAAWEHYRDACQQGR